MIQTGCNIQGLHKQTNKQIFAVCSSYQDIDVPEVINNIDKFVEHSIALNKDIIIGTDSNAHSQLWMSPSSNPRGEIFEDFISHNNLFVCNIGNKYTYDCAIGKSIIDLSLVSTTMVDRIKDWVVHDEDFLSDHKLITFNLNTNKAQPIMGRNFKNAD